LGFDGKFHQQQLQQEQQEQKQLQHINLKNAIHTHPHVVFDAEAESLREEEDYFSLREDIYSLIVMSKNCGASFIFGIYVYIVKMTLFSVLAASVKPVGNPALWTDDVLIRIARVRLPFMYCFGKVLLLILSMNERPCLTAHPPPCSRKTSC
jgi:hypothetical protein